MATKNIVPRGNLEGNLGTEQKRWSGAFVGNLDVSDNITFPNGTITDIATEAEAEAGTDNTKVMTPAMVQKSKLRYKDLGELGLSNSVNWQEIANALLNKSADGAVLWMYINLGIQSNLTTLTPPSNSYKQGFLKMETRKGSCFVEILWYNSWRIDVGQLYADTVAPNWKQLATNGALSMPNTVDFIVFDMQLNTQYVAPADGWIEMRFNANANSYATVGLITGGAEGSFRYFKAPANSGWFTVMIPVAGNVPTYMSNLSNCEIVEQRFVPAQSAKGEV